MGGRVRKKERISKEKEGIVLEEVRGWDYDTGNKK